MGGAMKVVSSQSGTPQPAKNDEMFIEDCRRTRVLDWHLVPVSLLSST